MVLLDGTTAPEEGDEEDDAPDNDEEDRSGEELVAEEVEVLTVGSLNDPTSHNQEESWELKQETSLETWQERDEETDGKEEVEEE